MCHAAFKLFLLQVLCLFAIGLHEWYVLDLCTVYCVFLMHVSVYQASFAKDEILGLSKQIKMK